MKRYSYTFTPIKYVVIMLIMFLIVPMTILFFIWELESMDIMYVIKKYLVFLIITGPIVFWANKGNASVVIKDGMLINYINDGTSNFGWAEDIRGIKSITIAENEEIIKYYRNCKSKKVLLIDFGECNIKYISLTPFSRNQIKRMIRKIECVKKESQ